MGGRAKHTAEERAAHGGKIKLRMSRHTVQKRLGTRLRKINTGFGTRQKTGPAHGVKVKKMKGVFEYRR